MDLNHWVEALVQDVRYAFRGLRRSRVFTTVALLCLALGIGGNTAIFSLIHAVLLRTLPVRHPEELILVNYGVSRGPSAGSRFSLFSYPVYRDLRDRAVQMVDLIGYAVTELSLTTPAGAERVSTTLVTGNYYQVLGADALVGRTILLDDDGVRRCTAWYGDCLLTPDSRLCYIL